MKPRLKPFAAAPAAIQGRLEWGWNRIQVLFRGVRPAEQGEAA